MIAFIAVVAFQQARDLTPATDPRLAKAFAYRAEAKPLGTVVKAFAQATGVSLEVQGSMKQDLVTLYTANKKAGESLTVIADHFNWKWQASNGGYMLIQTTEGRKAEVAGLRAAIIGPYAAMRDAAQKRIANPPKTSRAELQKKIDEVNKQLEANPGNKELRLAALTLWSQLEEADDPYMRFVTQVTASLSDAKLAEFAQRTRLVFSYYPTNAQSPLGRLNRAAEILVNELAHPPTDEQPAESDVEGMVETPTALDPKEVGTVRVAFEAHRWGRYSGAGAFVAILDKNGAIIDQRNTEVPGSDRGEEETVRKLEDPILKAPLTMSDELKAKATPAGKDEFQFMFDLLATILGKPDVEPLQNLGWLIAEVGECANLPTIADAYDEHFSPNRPLIPQGNTAAQVLLSTTSPSQNISVANGWLRVRTDEWELARASTIPRAIYAPLARMNSQQAGLTLDQMGSFANRIDDLQASSPLLEAMLTVQLDKGFLGDGPGIYMLRFWDSLSMFQKRALLSGISLDLYTLSPAAIANVNEFLYRCGNSDSVGGSHRYDPDEDAAIDAPAEIADPEVTAAAVAAKVGAQFSEDLVKAMRSPDTEITQILPNGPLRGATIELNPHIRDGIGMLVGSEKAAIPVSMPISMLIEFEQMKDELPFLKLMGVRPALLSSYEFTLNCSPTVHRTFATDTCVSDPMYKYGPVDALPAAIRQRLAALRKLIDDRRKETGPPPGEPPPSQG